MSQFLRIFLPTLARVSSHVDDFNTRNKVLTAKLLRQGYRYHKLRKAFSKFYRRHFDIVSKYNVGLKTLLLQGLSEPELYGDMVFKFKKIIGNKASQAIQSPRTVPFFLLVSLLDGYSFPNVLVKGIVAFKH